MSALLILAAFFAPPLAAAAAARRRPDLVRAPPRWMSPTGGCDLEGTWADGTGEYAVSQAGAAVTALAVGFPGWHKATGTLAGDALAMHFDNGADLTAAVGVACSQLSWSNGATWARTQPVANVTTVHVVFMTHLDIGFTKLARDVCEQYFFTHFPTGIALSAELRALGGPARYAVTTHPWLIHEFYDAAAECARTARNASMLAMMDAAIAAGDVRWHGKPMNNFAELEDGPWFASSLQLAGRLNARFNTSWGALACKSTDVPGFSRSSIPIFAAAGKRSLHMGYNSNCRVPNIPMAFNWVHAETGTSLLTFVNNNYGSHILVPGSSDALVFYYSPDNTGPPPSAADVVAFWNSTAASYPNAQLRLSSLDAFTEAILPLTESLPQVVGEIGQSWSYGAPADPLKIAAFRTARRLRNEGVEAGWLDADDPHLLAYERRLWVGGPEHNWGVCFGCYLPHARGPGGNWSNAEFHALRPRADYAFVESGNVEKRNFTLPLPPTGAESPGFTAYLDELAARGAALLARAPDLAGYVRVDAGANFGACGRFSVVRFDATTGALTSLVDAATGHDWAAGTAGGLARFSYRTYTEENFNVWNREYNPKCGPPCQDFAKSGMDTANPVNATWAPALTALYRKTGAGAGSCGFVAALALPADAVALYGGAAALFVNFTVDNADAAAAPLPWLGVELTWLNKTATRLAESAWLSFAPALEPAADMRGWAMDVLGSPVSPLDVVDMGTRHIHAVWDGVRYDNRAAGGAFVGLRALDTPLVAPGDADHLLWYDGLTEPDLAGGWHFVRLTRSTPRAPAAPATTTLTTLKPNPTRAPRP
jgi:hypothetical protein